MITMAEMILNGATADDLGVSQQSWECRKKTLEAFLVYSEGEFTHASYLKWLEDTQDTTLYGQPIITEDRTPTPDTQASARIKMPRWSDLAKNLASEGVKFAKSGFKLVDVSVLDARKATCTRCEHFIEGKRCELCGCYMAAKAKIAAASCPKGYWLAEEE